MHLQENAFMDYLWTKKIKMHQTNWHDIYTQLSPKLLGICRRYIKDSSTAEDIVQDSFIVAIQKESDLKNKDLLNGWLSRIVINKALNYLKYETKNTATSAENIEFVDETTMTTPLELDLSSALLAADFSQNDLLEAIDSLSENHKSVFNLYIIDQFSHLEISKLLEISVGTSKSSLSRARKNIQGFLVEKLNVKKIEENKKRRVLFLLFLGLGNQLFAQKFKKSFADFEIQPKSKLDLSRKVADSTLNFAAKSASLAPVFTFGTAAIIASLILFYIVFKENNSVPIKEQNFELKVVEYTTSSFDSNKIKIFEVIPKLEQKNVQVEQTIKVEPKEKTTKIISTPKDTITPKVVVIKRQIIKKDTIYVQK